MASFNLLLGCAAGFGRRKQVPPPPPAPALPFDAPDMLAVAVSLAALVVLALASKIIRRSSKEPVSVKPRPRCTLVFAALDESLHAVWHQSDKTATAGQANEQLLASFTPDVPVAAHKLTQNLGRLELVRHVGSAKSFYSGYVAFVALAHKHSRATVQVDLDAPGRAILLSAVTTDSRVVRCKVGASLELELSEITAVAATSAEVAGEFSMKYYDKASFESLGNKLGCALSLLDKPNSPSGERAPTSPAKLGRRPSRSDLKFVVAGAAPTPASPSRVQ